MDTSKSIPQNNHKLTHHNYHHTWDSYSLPDHQSIKIHIHKNVKRDSSQNPLHTKLNSALTLFMEARNKNNHLKGLPFLPEEINVWIDTSNSPRINESTLDRETLEPLYKLIFNTTARAYHDKNTHQLSQPICTNNPDLTLDDKLDHIINSLTQWLKLIRVIQSQSTTYKDKDTKQQTDNPQDTEDTQQVITLLKQHGLELNIHASHTTENTTNDNNIIKTPNRLIRFFKHQVLKEPKYFTIQLSTNSDQNVLYIISNSRVENELLTFDSLQNYLTQYNNQKGKEYEEKLSIEAHTVKIAIESQINGILHDVAPKPSPTYNIKCTGSHYLTTVELHIKIGTHIDEDKNEHLNQAIQTTQEIEYNKENQTIIIKNTSLTNTKYVMQAAQQAQHKYRELELKRTLYNTAYPLYIKLNTNQEYHWDNQVAQFLQYLPKTQKRTEITELLYRVLTSPKTYATDQEPQNLGEENTTPKPKFIHNNQANTNQQKLASLLELQLTISTICQTLKNSLETLESNVNSSQHLQSCQYELNQENKLEAHISLRQGVGSTLISPHHFILCDQEHIRFNKESKKFITTIGVTDTQETIQQIDDVVSKSLSTTQDLNKVLATSKSIIDTTSNNKATTYRYSYEVVACSDDEISLFVTVNDVNDLRIPVSVLQKLHSLLDSKNQPCRHNNHLRITLKLTSITGLQTTLDIILQQASRQRELYNKLKKQQSEYFNVTLKYFDDNKARIAWLIPNDFVLNQISIENITTTLNNNITVKHANNNADLYIIWPADQSDHDEIANTFREVIKYNDQIKEIQRALDDEIKPDAINFHYIYSNPTDHTEKIAHFTYNTDSPVILNSTNNKFIRVLDNYIEFSLNHQITESLQYLTISSIDKVLDVKTLIKEQLKSRHVDIKYETTTTLKYTISTKHTGRKLHIKKHTSEPEYKIDHLGNEIVITCHLNAIDTLYNHIKENKIILTVQNTNRQKSLMLTTVLSTTSITTILTLIIYIAHPNTTQRLTSTIVTQICVLILCVAIGELFYMKAEESSMKEARYDHFCRGQTHCNML